MRNLDNELKNKKIDYKKLLNYGFIKDNKKYIYKTQIIDGQFEITVEVQDNKVTSKLIDLFNEEEYILVDIPESTGKFVGKVREEYENILNDIIVKCTNRDTFKNSQTKEIIKYVKEKYNDELEFLWEKFDNNAICRNKQNNKWYVLFCTVTEDKIGIDSNKEIEIIDLRYQKEKINEIIDNKNIYPGYHMNKKSWITIKLDNTVDIRKICDYIDNSYKLSIGKV